MARFVLESVLRARDELSKPVTAIWQRVQDGGDRAAKRFGKRLRKELSGEGLKKHLTRTLAAGGVLTGVGALGLYKAADALDSMSNSMARTATFAKELKLDPTLFAALEAEGARNGIENIEDIARSVEEMYLRVSELQDGTGSLKGFLDGIGAKGLIKQFEQAKDGTESLKIALAALATETDERNRVALADALFGGNDAALDLRRIFQSTEALKEFLSRTEEISGATKEQYKDVAALAQARADLNAKIGARSRELTGRLAPAVTKAVKASEAWLDKNDELIDQKLDEFVEWVTEKFDELLKLDLGKWFTDAVEGGTEATKMLHTLGRGVIDGGRVILDWGGRVSSIAKKLGLDANTLVTVAGAFFAAWGVGKIVALSHGILTLGKNAFTAVTNLKKVAATAGSASKALTTALSFTGAVGAAFTLASWLGDVIKKLTGIEKIAKRNVKYDTDNQADQIEDQVVELKKQRAELQKALPGRGADLNLSAQAKFGFQSPASIKQRIAELDAQIKREEELSNTIQGASRVERARIAGDEVAREELAGVYAGRVVISEAKELQRVVHEQGGSVEALEKFVPKEQERRRMSARADRAQEVSANIITKEALGVEGTIAKGPSQAKVNREVLYALDRIVRSLQATEQGVAENLQEMQRVSRDERTRADLGQRKPL